MNQPDLFSQPVPRFDSGIELTKADHVRLGAQIKRVLAVLQEGGWWSVPEIKTRIWSKYGIEDPETSISAQIRNLKKERHGEHTVERRSEGRGFYRFRLVA